MHFNHILENTHSKQSWINMVCPDSIGLLGTKRRCGICLCVCIISDFLVLVIYWSRIGDALKNPFIAIIESLQPDHGFAEAINLPQHLNASAQTIKTNATDYWDENNRPGVGRMIYHFGATLLYLGYTSVNLMILSNTLIKLCYRIDEFSQTTRENKLLRFFIFYGKSRLARWYFVTVIILFLLICMDDVLISHSIGYKLPFNELTLEIIRLLTIQMYLAVSHIINSLFFIIFILISAIIIMSIKMTLILTCIDDFYGGPLKRYTEGATNQATSRRRTRSACEIGTEMENISMQPATTRHTSSKTDDLPPKYEDETSPPSYDEALALASSRDNEIHSDFGQEI